MAAVDYTRLAPVEEMAGEDDEETQQWKSLLRNAESFLGSFAWCAGIRSEHLGLGVADVVGVFLFEIEPAKPGVDSLLWVVVGDIPPAYLVTDDTPDPPSALRAYIGEMRRWVEAVKAGKPVTELIPVNGAPTRDNAMALESRLAFIEREILPARPGDSRPAR